MCHFVALPLTLMVIYFLLRRGFVLQCYSFVRYSATCHQMLRSICERLLLPIPTELLGGGDGSPDSNVVTGSSKPMSDHGNMSVKTALLRHIDPPFKTVRTKR